MKKQLKKSFLMFMSVVMIMTSWVWVAPEKAEVSAAGTYTVTMDFTVIDACNATDATATIYYLSGNNANSEASFVWNLDRLEEMESDGMSFSITSPSFSGQPTKIVFDIGQLGMTTAHITLTGISVNGTKVIEGSWVAALGWYETFSKEFILVDFGERLPEGYNFNEDSYSFENYTSVIPYGYFKTMYNDGKAWSLCTKKWLQGGVCFGMTYTTASLYNGLPSGHTIRNLSSNAVLSIGNYSLTLESFIDYAQIYQFSEEFAEGNVWTNGTTIYNLVKQYVENDNIGVTIGMTRRDNTGGHRVLAVGIEGNDILIDDPNNMNNYERLTVNSDGSWSFSGLTGWNSDTCYIRYNLDYFGPYKFIRSMKPLNVNDSFIDNSTIDKIAQNSTSDYLSKDSILLSINSAEYSLDNKEFSKVELEFNSNQDISEVADLYWIDKDETITITDIEAEDSEIEVAGNDNIVKLKLDNSSELNITLDEDESVIETNIVTTKGDSYEIERVSFDDNSNPQTLSISGTANGTEITATQTETGLLVTGISDGTVTLSKDDEVVATQEIKDAESDIEITYDTDGSSDDLDVEYHSHSYKSTIATPPTCTETGVITYTCSCGDSYTEVIPETGHKDDNGDYICDNNCGYEYEKPDEPANTCSHLCHKTGISGILWKIVRFFWKLFGMNPVCECGASHY